MHQVAPSPPSNVTSVWLVGRVDDFLVEMQGGQAERIEEQQDASDGSLL